MAQAAGFVADYISAVTQLVEVLNKINGLRDRVTQDPTLFAQYLLTENAREDLTEQEFTNSNSALGEVLFAYNSGSPTQKSMLFELL